MTEIGNILNIQQQHWDNVLSSEPDKFGVEPSQSAINALSLFRKENITNIIELGGGQGRDSIYFAQNNIKVTVLDYSENGIKTIIEKAAQLKLSNKINAKMYDAREPLPFDDNTFEACYSHMLYSSEFTIAELKSMSAEISRIVKPCGINYFTTRNVNDPYFQTGIHRGENLYEIDGYIIHFLSKENIEYITGKNEIVEIKEIEEGGLPKRMYEVIVKLNCK